MREKCRDKWPFLKKEEIKESILNKETIKKETKVFWNGRLISEEDKKELKKLGYYVYTGVNSSNEPFVRISW